MKRLFTAILLLGALTASAQIAPYDRQTWGETDIIGTSRYVAMAGAMAAVGGDASAASDNPAGLGLYRRDELMITLEHQIDKPSLGGLTGKFSCAQASWNFCFLNDRMTGVVANNIMLNYRRVKNFNRQYTVPLRALDYSQTDVMAMKTDGLPEIDLEGDRAWYDSEVGWLSKIGFEGYLIDPDSTGTNLWLPANAGAVEGALGVRESGSVDEFSVSWGLNVSNKWYLGLELGARSLTYLKTTSYEEFFAGGNSYYLDSYVSASGVGFLSKIGLLYRPTRFLRFGAAFHAPVPMAITVHNYADLASNNGARYTVKSPDNSHSPSGFAQPLKAVAGMAFQIGQYGLVSLEYDYRHDLDKRVLDTHLMKVGLEGVVANNWFINVGYALKMRTLDHGKWADPIHQLDYNSVRMDTEFANLMNAHYISGGVSFRHKYVVAGLAYQCCLKKENIRFHELETAAVGLNTTTHRIVLSLSWRR